ncbi:MAG: hypothetical protein ACRC2H_01320 [Silanimonas sp.]
MKRLLPMLLIAAITSCVVPGARAAATTDNDKAPALSRRVLADLWAKTTPLATLQQGPQQSEQAFLQEVAAVIDAFTESLKAEVCGLFERDESTARLVITLLTQGSPAFCLHPRGSADHGDGLEGLSIHSHVATRPSSAHIAEADVHGQPIRFLGARFSTADIAAGPGYLVHRGRLWHQRGLGTQRFVARVDAVRPASTPQTLIASTAEARATGSDTRSDWRDDGWSITGGES